MVTNLAIQSIQFDQEALRNIALYSFASEHELVKSVLEVKDLFTIHRQRLGEYLHSPRLVSAYCHFYLPTNFPKFQFLVRSLPSFIVEDFKNCDFIDIGTGPGTFLLAFLDFVGPSYQGRVFGLDSSTLMLQQAQRCLDFFLPFRPDLHLGNKWPFQKISFVKEKRILFFGHSYNEMAEQKSWELIKDISPHYLVLMEPGTMESFRKVLDLRKRLKGEDYQILYPCPNLEFSCPMEEVKNNWCHQLMYQSYPRDLERLSQLLKINRHSLPLVLHVYVKTKRRSEKDLNETVKRQEAAEVAGFERFARLFRCLKETKYSFQWELCIELEEHNQIIKVEVMKRNLTSQRIKDLRELTPGESVHFRVEKKLHSEIYRILLSE